MNSAPLRKMMSEQAVARESIHDSQKVRTEMTGGKSFAP
jgi:predicted transcriptional regulator